MRQNYQKLIITILLIAMFGAYTWYLFTKNEANSSSDARSSVLTSNSSITPSNSPDREVSLAPTTEEIRTDRANKLAIEDISLIDIDNLQIDEFRDLHQILTELNIPPAVMMLVSNGDLLGASAILLSEPNNPRFHLALELISITCSAMRYEQKFLEADVVKRDNENSSLSKQEVEFFDELARRRLTSAQYFNQSCDDFKRAEVIDIEQQRTNLQTKNDSPLAQLVSQMNSLKQKDIIRLMREAHTQQPSRFTHKNLAAILLTSDNQEDLTQGIELFLSLNQPEPDIIQSVIHCLENQCRELSHNLGGLDAWLEKSATFGSPLAVKKLSDRLILDEKPTEALAWQEFQFALLKSGCYKSINDYEHIYTTTKTEIEELKTLLGEQQKQQALELANQQYDDYAAQAKRWLKCR